LEVEEVEEGRVVDGGRGPEERSLIVDLKRHTQLAVCRYDIQNPTCKFPNGSGNRDDISPATIWLRLENQRRCLVNVTGGPSPPKA